MLQLTPRMLWAYLSEANTILAVQQLKAFEASTYPQLDKHAKKTVWELYSQVINPKTEKQKWVENRRQYKLLKARGLNRR